MLQREARAVVKALGALSWPWLQWTLVLVTFGKALALGDCDWSWINMPLAHLVDPFKQVIPRIFCMWCNYAAKEAIFRWTAYWSMMRRPMEVEGRWKKLWKKRLRSSIPLWWWTMFSFCNWLYFDAVKKMWKGRTFGSVQVANVTRAGCEKASTGQFELLRWLICKYLCWCLLIHVTDICKYMYLCLFVLVQSSRAGFFWESVPCQKSPGEHPSFRQSVTGQVKTKAMTTRNSINSNLTFKIISARARTLERCMLWKFWKRQHWR